MNKVILSKEVAKALEEVKKLPAFEGNVDALLNSHAQNNENEYWADRCLNDVDMATFARAVIFGYEVEQTPKEKVLALFKEWKQKEEEGMKTGRNAMEARYRNRSFGAIDVLNALGIEIEYVDK